MTELLFESIKVIAMATEATFIPALNDILKEVWTGTAWFPDKSIRSDSTSRKNISLTVTLLAHSVAVRKRFDSVRNRFLRALKACWQEEKPLKGLRKGP